MPPTKDTKHRHARKTASTPRKSKPKFEIPPDSNVPDTAAGWVYRADEVPEQTRTEAAGVTANQAANRTTIDETSSTNPFLVAGMGLFFIGLGTMGVLSLAAMGAIVAPFRMTRRLFTE